MTSGIQALQESQPATFQKIMTAVHSFENFEKGNDPYGEHDFGSVEVDGIKVFWKIDYYDKANPDYGSDEPENPEATDRVLLVMLAEEY